MSPAAPSIAVLIPAYNAEATLAGVLSKALALGFPVFVIDDGSTDRTAEVAGRFPLRQVLTHPLNRGKGAALMTGFSAAAQAGFSHALTLDADGQHPIESLPEFADACRGNPEAILVGNRFGDTTIGAMPGIRRLSNGLSSKLISLAAGTTIPDAQCGLRIYPLEATLAIPLESTGYALESEVLVKAARRGVKVENIPISCHYPEGTATSRYRAVVDSWRIAKVVWRAMRERKETDPPPVSE